MKSEFFAVESVAKGEVITLFAFDVGYEVDLAQIQQLMSVHTVKPLSGVKQKPAYLQYTQPPQMVPLGELTVLSEMTGVVEATIYDFGAVSLSYRFPLLHQGSPLPLLDLPALSKSLFDAELEIDARTRVNDLVERIRPAISRPALSALVEDYYIFALTQIKPEVTPQVLLHEYQELLAQTLRFETQPLSLTLQREALAKSIAYYQTDLAIIDWNAAILYDIDYEDTVRVLELLNVELLEARYLDAELDKRIDAYEHVVSKNPGWALPLLNPYRQTIQELAELQIESALLSERVDNALKLIGDLYLARIHALASERFYIATWDASISRKLDIIGHLYQLLTNRMSNTQGQTLELIIILLIVMEIFLR